jgi:putative exosortase-associated protein (TIGR04073 family)
MRKSLLIVSSVLLLAVLATGCANVERKFGRGMANTKEIVRWGEYRRTMEQSSLFNSPEYTYTTAGIHGFNRTLARTGIGIYEVITAPFPPYGPVCTRHFSPEPVFPDNYRPDIMADSMFETDTHIGFSGGPIAPGIPGNRFQVLSGQ